MGEHQPADSSFNPRAREERDEVNDDFEMIRDVSIHALAKSATWYGCRESRQDTGFNPRAREERDLLIIASCTPSFVFQSTRSRRARRSCTAKWCRYGTFQSTRSRRARRSSCRLRCLNCRFQSTRSRRARHLNDDYPELPALFQSTRSRRARPSASPSTLTVMRFNPRAREERDSLRLPCALHLVVSIHALAKSATGRDHGRFSRARGFNPRAREERDSTESSIVTWYSRFNPRAREERDRLRRLQD